MKIGILTFHEVFNPGAFLQALGTQTLLQQLGHEVCIIDYNPPKHRYTTRKHVRALSYRLPFRIRQVMQGRGKAQAFAVDRASCMHLTHHFRNHADLVLEHFDAVLIGADIVWNFDLRQIAHDPVYFGGYLDTERLISFAPSVGPCDIEQEIPRYVSEGLARFHAISVRDRKTQQMVEKILDISPPILCDPAFHLDPIRLLQDMQVPEPPKKPYLLVYLMGQFCDAAFIAEVKAFAHKRKLRIVSTLYPNSWADENRTMHGPLQWLSLMKNAEHVVTNTFHGTVFSIMLQKSFAVQYTPLIQSKTEGMLEALALENRVIRQPTDLSSILSIDWAVECVAAVIQEWKAKAKEFLEEALIGSKIVGNESSTR
jgi:hypothetical protein